MRTAAAIVGGTMLLMTLAPTARANQGEERSGAARAAYAGLAVVANVTPIVSALYAPSCLPGYILCKASFAAASLIAACGQVVISGGQDTAQMEAILYRGFAGDWYLTAEHTSGDVKPQVLPDPPPAEGAAAGEAWQPPPL